MAAVNAEENSSDKTFEHKWVITNWESVVQDAKLVENAKTEIKCVVDNVEIAKFIVAAKLYYKSRHIGLYWKLTHKTNWLDDVRTELVVKLPKRNRKFESQADAVLENNIDIITGLWNFSNTTDIPKNINEEGSLEIHLTLTLKKLANPSCCNGTEEKLRNEFQTEFKGNMSDLLDNQSNSDLKIVTKDDIEILANTAIIFARCPTFESGILEKKPGQVTVKDFSGKTMKIILHYWYTADLQPSWKDDDTVVEFTCAADKYRMTKVLEMLDNMLGQDFQAENYDGILLELLKIVKKLSLKSAEDKILKLIVNKVRQAEGGAGLLRLFPLTTEKIEKEKHDIFPVLKSFEGVLSGNNNEVTSTDLKLIDLACKYEMKNVETKLLQHIVGTVIKVGSSEELFALFDIHYETKDDGTNEVCVDESKNQTNQEVVNEGDVDQ